MPEVIELRFSMANIEWLWNFPAVDSAWRGVLLAAVSALAALVGITWFLASARAERRWRVALDAYTEQEETKMTNSGRNSHARAQSQDR